MSKKEREQSLRLLPSVDETLKDSRVAALLAAYPRSVVVETARAALAGLRRRILAGEPDGAGGSAEDREPVGAAKPVGPTSVADGENAFLDIIVSEMAAMFRGWTMARLQPVINASGVILHTNLGRALLSERARAAVHGIVSSYSNLELELAAGRRGSRYAPLEPLLTALTGAEAVLAVNNNAAAVLLALSTLAKEREVVVSRGQLVEIGGSFRIPEVMAQSGARLVEVGATNKTHPADYRRAINENTALLLHVHTSNYRIIGFSQETSMKELTEIGQAFSLPVMSDLGSGSLIDLSRYGLPGEPTVQEIVAAGVDVVTFSGDKLLGGPQCGIIAGRRRYIDQMKKNPLLRALRVDKMTVAALEATLLEYLETECDAERLAESLPTLRMLTADNQRLAEKAEKLAGLLREAVGAKAAVAVINGFSVVGGGSLPTAELPTFIVRIDTVAAGAGVFDTKEPSPCVSAAALQSALLRGEPAVMSRVQEDSLLLDVRALGDDELPALAAAIGKVV